MGNIPVVHEAITSIQSLGDVITGDTEGARQRWVDYSESSIIGSGSRALIALANDDMEEAARLGKATGRATGSALMGGGALRSVPLFHELATCGDSLGDMIGGGDDEAARRRWVDYSERSVIGSGTRALIALANDDMKEAARLGIATGKAATSGAITAVTIGATVATGGIFAPLGVAVSATACGVTGAYCGVVETVAQNSIYDQEIKSGDVVGAGLLGGISGAAAGYGKAKASQGRVYQVMEENRGSNAIHDNFIQNSRRQYRPNGETWVTESNKHSAGFMKQRTEQGMNAKTYQITMKKAALEKLKSESIPQRKSGIINHGNSKPRNVINSERLSNHPKGKVNIGIKTANLREFNDNIIKIKEIDPNSRMQQGIMKPIKRYSKASPCIASLRGEDFDSDSY